MSGHMGDLSPTQEKALKEIKATFHKQLNSKQDDYFLLQFLRARKFDVQKTEGMIRKHLQWRKEFPEDFLLNEYEPPELLLKYMLPPLLGYDKDNCPVRIVHIGHQDLRGLVSCFRRSEIRKCITWFLDTDKEAMRRRFKETSVHVETRTFIFDLNGLNFRQIYHREIYELVISLLKLYECNFPENLKTAYLINAPSFFTWMLNMVKTLLTEDTVKKLKVFGYSGWKEELLKSIDADILPVIYGGTRTDPDGNPNCPSLTNAIDPIPKEYYLRNQNRLNPAEDPCVQKVVVGRRSKHSVPLRVEVPGSTLSWDVDCQECDIKVCLIYSEITSPETVVETSLITGDYGTENGCYLAERTGNYSLVLDNSYSILRSKEVFYRTYVSTVTASENIELPSHDRTNVISEHFSTIKL